MLETLTVRIRQLTTSFPFSLGVGAILGDTMAAGTIISANAMLLLSLRLW